eukprot:5079329-Alexandrium_andersonii.AAC.1
MRANLNRSNCPPQPGAQPRRPRADAHATAATPRPPSHDAPAQEMGAALKRGGTPPRAHSAATIAPP